MEFGRVRQVRVPSAAPRVFSGRLFDVFQWEAQLFDGTIAVHEMAKRADTVNVIAANAAGLLLVTEQEQPDVDRPFYDFPGGRIEPDETPEAAARRELLEETGYEAGYLHPMFEYQATDRVDSRTYIFGTQDLIKQASPTPDAGERVSLEWLRLDEIKAWALVNHRLAIVPVLLAADVDELFSRRWVE